MEGNIDFEPTNEERLMKMLKGKRIEGGSRKNLQKRYEKAKAFLRKDN